MFRGRKNSRRRTSRWTLVFRETLGGKILKGTLCMKVRKNTIDMKLHRDNGQGNAQI